MSSPCHGPGALPIEPVKGNALYSHWECMLLPTIGLYPAPVTTHGPRCCIPISTHRGRINKASQNKAIPAGSWFPAGGVPSRILILSFIHGENVE